MMTAMVTVKPEETRMDMDLPDAVFLQKPKTVDQNQSKSDFGWRDKSTVSKLSSIKHREAKETQVIHMGKCDEG